METTLGQLKTVKRSILMAIIHQFPQEDNNLGGVKTLSHSDE